MNVFSFQINYCYILKHSEHDQAMTGVQMHLPSPLLHCLGLQMEKISWTLLFQIKTQVYIAKCTEKKS